MYDRNFLRYRISWLPSTKCLTALLFHGYSAEKWPIQLYLLIFDLNIRIYSALFIGLSAESVDRSGSTQIQT